jgi:hypothetical protein
MGRERLRQPSCSNSVSLSWVLLNAVGAGLDEKRCISCHTAFGLFWRTSVDGYQSTSSHEWRCGSG